MYRNYLWATSRSGWVKKNAKTGGCLFCRIARGDRSVPAKVIYRDKKVMVIMNIFPYNIGHLQVIPIRHVVWPYELSGDDYHYFSDMIKKTVLMLKKALNPKGFNIGFNLGGVLAGGSVLHMHAQIVPRYLKDLGFMEVTAETKVMPESLDQTFEKIMKFADVLKE